MKKLDDVFADVLENRDKRLGKDDYDREKKQFRSLLVPIVIFAMFTFGAFITGLLFGLPYLFSISYFALAINIVAVIYNHWALNSMAIPIGVVFIPVAIGDLLVGNWYAFIVHLPTVIFFLMAITRQNTSYIVMILTTAIFSAWIYTSSNWVVDPYYGFITSFIHPSIIALLAGITSLVTSTVKTLLVYRFKDKGGKIDCDKGICPL